MRPRAGAALVLVACLSLGGAHRPLAAQSPAEPGSYDYLAANVLVGGLTSGIWSVARGGPFLRPFLRGALGGSASYAGKRVSGAAFGGAGFVGRQIGALGASLVRNAASGAGWVDTLFVPLGPGRGYVLPHDLARSTYRVDLEEVAWVVYGISRDHLTLDVGESFSSGAFVFNGDDRLRGEDDDAIGRAAPGSISVRRSGEELDAATLTHERVHIVQLDHLKIVAGLPLEGWARDAWGIGSDSRFGRFDVGIGYYPLLWLLTAPWPAHGSRPLEREAEYVESLRRGG